jgi:hypothetical protein
MVGLGLEWWEMRRGLGMKTGFAEKESEICRLQNDLIPLYPELFNPVPQ